MSTVIAAPLDGAQRALIVEIERIFAAVPEVNCRGKCQACCGPIGYYPTEAAYIRARTGRTELPAVNSALTCSALTPNGRCGIYAARPLICRLWGAVKRMRCPHGCRPKRWLSDAEAGAMIARLKELSGDDSRPTFTLPAI